MKATHYHPGSDLWYESYYVVVNGIITHYKIEGSVWRTPDPENYHEQFPPVNNLKETRNEI